jgi:hypothetical protein
MALPTITINHGDYAYKSWSNGYVISLTLTEKSTDIASNTSQVSYLFTISNTNNNRFYANDYSWTISIGGHTISISHFNFDLRENYTTQTIASGTIPVKHNTDGSLDMPYNVSIPNIQSGNKYGPPAMSITDTWALTKIPRVSKVSFPGGTIGHSVNIEVTKADDSLTHTLAYKFGNLTDTITEKTSLEVVPWRIPASFYSKIPNNSSGQGTITCTTYSGDKEIGTDSATFYAKADEDESRPVFTDATIVEKSEVAKTLTGNDPNKLIRYVSSVDVTANYTLRNSANLKSYTLINNGKKYIANPATIPIDAVGCGTFSFTVVDSREFTTDPSPVVITREIVPYVKLTCNLSDNKPDANGHMDVVVKGNCFKGNFGAVENELTVKYRYKVSKEQWLDTDEEWHTMVVTQSGDSYTASASLDDLEYQTAYTFQAQAEDKLGKVDSNPYTVKAMPVFDWGENDFRFNVPVFGITADMVGARHTATDGANLLYKLGVESGLLFIRDGGNPNNYYLGVFMGYQYGTAPIFHTISANTLGVSTNQYGTVTAKNAVGEVTYVVIPFTQL